MPRYRAVKGIDWVGAKGARRVEPGEIADDFLPTSLPWLVEHGDVVEVDEQGKSQADRDEEARAAAEAKAAKAQAEADARAAAEAAKQPTTATTTSASGPVSTISEEV